MEKKQKDGCNLYTHKPVISAVRKKRICNRCESAAGWVEPQHRCAVRVPRVRYIWSGLCTFGQEAPFHLHLLSKADIICVLMVAASEKVVKVYCYNGLAMYFTDRNSNRTVRSWSGADFKMFAEAEERINHPYDEAYISTFTFDCEHFYIEHNEKLNVDEVGTIIGFVAGALTKMSTECNE